MSKILTLSKLDKILKDSIKLKKVVVTNGCFDIIHSGHIEIFKKSKELGDVLIVLVNTDKSIKKNKGINRPIIKQEQRLKVLSAISYIDYIVPFDQLTPIKLYNKIKPSIVTKGKQYKINQIAGNKTINKNKGTIKLIKMVDNISTSKIIKKIQSI
jgi:rfaE bifunctional protein nucleotidyltransferase chain/domain